MRLFYTCTNCGQNPLSLSLTGWMRTMWDSSLEKRGPPEGFSSIQPLGSERSMWIFVGVIVIVVH